MYAPIPVNLGTTGTAKYAAVVSSTIVMVFLLCLACLCLCAKTSCNELHITKACSWLVTLVSFAY